ncbi:phage integrase N-terminal SAM-like domain-containing protein [Desulfurobacterium atlanticum]|uniref:Phage integrase, N-terminal SAM-like domain n=1 Tax=Desulfurobacterium atlanticum TaxID=240169 RepID=A0A238ZHN2_9BACT|nr:phage integrase N-terminal SAM-like domain-containing protein [Desulfurobacterium atlanticum]SNR82203.1 Phage integrase, N-terminal SAM-like domain [Desulfurobacterium atlanticum]
MNKIEEFRKYLQDNGYSKSSVSTYIRAVEKFYLFLKFYGFTEKKFDEEKLVSFLSSTYKTRKSLYTAVSAISRYLSFVFKKRVKIGFDEIFVDDFREFKEISDEKFSEILEMVEKRRKKDLKFALYLILFLGLKPSEIVKISTFRLSFFGRVPAIDENGIKRLIVDDRLLKIIKEMEDENGVVRFKVKPDSLKVVFFRIVGKEFSVNDFRENYAYRLLKKGLPVDIVVEFSQVPLDRVSYLYRVLTLKSKQEIIGEKLTDF